MTNAVALLRCATYDPETVYAAIRRGLDLLGGLPRFVKPGQHVFLKVNLLRASKPEAAIVTHPSVVQAVARLVREAGATATVGDSPGGPLRETLLRLTYSRTGMDHAAANAGARLSFDVQAVQVPNPDGQLIKLFDTLKAVAEADVVINLAKLKTHNFMVFTGAMKNLFGTIPGLTKIGYHAKMQNAGNFAKMLVDLSGAIRPVLTVIDGIVGMEGNGPSAGDPKEIGALIIGQDLASMDLLACSLVGIDPARVPTLIEAKARGLTSGRVDDLAILGEPLAGMKIAGFRAPVTAGLAATQMPGFVGRRLARHLLYNPVPSESKCVHCGVCAQNCPAKAITVDKRRTVIDYGRCIRCYCCHELCPEKAVDLHRSFLGNVAARARLG